MMRMSCRIVQTSGVRRAICFAVILLGTACWLKAAEAATPQTPIGWAVVNAKGVGSTTGGGDGKIVTARTSKEMAGYASSKEPLTILVVGTLTGSGNINIASNKTILGVGSSAKIIHHKPVGLGR